MQKEFFLAPFLSWAILLSACGPSSSVNASNTLAAIYTSAAQTVAAQQASSTPPAIDQSVTLTPIATALDTDTPAPTNPPTLVLALPTSTTGSTTLSGSGCENSAYVSDVTIPDGTAENPGATFVKTWALQNTGSCTWDTGFTIRFFSGDQMGGTSGPVTSSVAPSGQTDVSVTLTAPLTAGTYQGNWRLADNSEVAFGEIVDVVIDVNGNATDTPELTDTPADTATDTPITPGYTSAPTNTCPDQQRPDLCSDEHPGPGTNEHPGPGTNEHPGPGTNEHPGPGTNERPGPGTNEYPGSGTN